MFALYTIIKNKEDILFKNLDGREIIIPRGSKSEIIEINDDWYTVEFLNHNNGYPIVYDFKENEIEHTDYPANM